jgi:hypothetical protein
MHKHELAQSLKPVPRTVSSKTLMSVSSSLFEAVDSPRSLAAYLMLKHREYAQLVNLEINPDNYQNSHEFADDYLATKFLSKYPDFVHTDLDPEKAALELFFKYEEHCRLTNIKFKRLSDDPSLWDPYCKDVLFLAKRKISKILGKPNLNEIADRFGWGPGATTAASGNHTSAYVKFTKNLDVTSNSLAMGWSCVNSTPSWVNCQLQTDEFPSVDVMLTENAFNIVKGNEIVFVPKNAKTHRIIAKEPHVNSYLQKGFGATIRKRLRDAVNVDLKDQTLNQRLAKEGSLTGALATIDLSGASDTISQELVRFLLPGSWFSLLDQIRSKLGYLRNQDTWHYYHKFSSMGNACTFELESLIFWALCKSCLEINGGAQTLNVYGDDIIVPCEHYDSVAKVIDFVGFSINYSKSFSSGRFRESCGKDYFDGIDVRPIFLKEAISNAESLFKLANSVRRYSHRRNFNYGCDYRFLACWRNISSRLPGELKHLRIPEGFGDVGLLVNFDEACPSRKHPVREAGWGGYIFKGLTRHPAKLEMKDRNAGYTAVLSAIGGPLECGDEDVDKMLVFDAHKSRVWLSKASSVDYIDGSLIRSGIPLLGHHDLRKMTYPKVTRIHTHGWYDFGPWN